jgi:O-antigen/teichoic acid export membrane protein
MRFEELQAVWEAQTDSPVFSLNEFGLHMALYQQRERARKRLFWGIYFPFYVMSLFMLGVLAVILPAFYFKDPARDFPMNMWDGLVFLGAAGSLLFAAASMYSSRKRHENEQKVLAPSLRQEIDRNIAHVEFETEMATSYRAFFNAALVNLGALLLCWEMGRLNGNRMPWDVVSVLLPLCAVSFWAMWVAVRKARDEIGSPRKRALEALRAKLDEGAATTQQ